MHLSTNKKLIALICGLIGFVSGILGIIQFFDEKNQNKSEETVQILLQELEKVQKSNQEKENLEKTINNLIEHQKKLYNLIDRELNSSIKNSQKDMIIQAQKIQVSPDKTPQDSLALIKKNEEIGTKINDLEYSRERLAITVNSLKNNPSIKKDPILQAKIKELEGFDNFIKNDLEKFKQMNKNLTRDFNEFKKKNEK